MHATPVTLAIIAIIRNENAIIESPSKPNPKVFFADSIFLGSPDELMTLYPAKINMITTVSPANMMSARIRFTKTIRAQSSVAGEFEFVHAPHD
jgi:hypothetical protein